MSTLETVVLPLSYAAAISAMIVALTYLVCRLRTFLTTTTMLLTSLLLIYGPTFLSFTLTSGEYAFPIRRLLGNHGQASDLWLAMAGKFPDFNSILAAMNFSVALMYLGIIAGIELVGRIAARPTAYHSRVIANWTNQEIRDDAGDSRVLLAAIMILSLFMLFISLKESHLATIEHFFAEASNRTDLRLHHSGSPNYVYNVALSAIAPMLVIWGALAAYVRRSLPLLAATFILFSVTLIGKVESLSKAPPTFFLIQLAIALFLAYSNRVTWKTVLAATFILGTAIYLIVRIVVQLPSEIAILELAYSRTFETESDTLLQYFATFPRIYPFKWGANIRPLAALMQIPHEPSFVLVAKTWARGDASGYTTPSLFIADAWADFSYAGVILYSVLVGAVCRAIDVIFLAQGKSVAAIAVLGATFWGILTLLTTALNIAFLSGGLLLAPAIAALLVMSNRLGSRVRGE